MNFYEAVVKFKQLKTKEDNDQRHLFVPADEKNPRNYIREAFESVNRSFGVRCDAKEAFGIYEICKQDENIKGVFVWLR